MDKTNNTSNRRIKADMYRNKYSHWTNGFWTMHNMSNRQTIYIGKILDYQSGKDE